MNKVWATVKHEFHEVLPPTIFFLISFHIVVLDRALMLREYGVQVSAIAGATVAALQLNRPGVVNLRRLLFAAGKHPPPEPQSPASSASGS